MNLKVLTEMKPPPKYSVTQILFGQTIPDFAYLPHVLLQPSEDILAQVAKISGIKFGPWPVSPQEAFDYLEDIVCDEADKFSSWAKESCQEIVFQYAAKLSMVSNGCILVNSETDQYVLEMTFPSVVRDSPAMVWQSLVYALDRLDSVGIPILADYDYILFVFSGEKGEIVKEIIRWANVNQIPWGQVIPPQSQVVLSGPIFKEWR